MARSTTKTIRSKSKGPKASATAAAAPSKFDLYEIAVTNAPALAVFLYAAYGAETKRPSELREDFSGSGALAREWANVWGPAIAVDKDVKALRAHPESENVTTVADDVRACHFKADIITATNFPLGYFHLRSELVGYLRHARRCLRPRGLFCCDTYGGSDAFTPGVSKRLLHGPKGEKLEYAWEQVSADPVSGLVRNAIHFRVTGGARRASGPLVLRNAFTYHWRLWSIPELRDCLTDAGFKDVEVYNRLQPVLDRKGMPRVSPVKPDVGFDDPFVVYILGRT